MRFCPYADQVYARGLPMTVTHLFTAVYIPTFSSHSRVSSKLMEWGAPHPLPRLFFSLWQTNICHITFISVSAFLNCHRLATPTPYTHKLASTAGPRLSNLPSPAPSPPSPRVSRCQAIAPWLGPNKRLVALFGFAQGQISREFRFGALSTVTWTWAEIGHPHALLARLDSFPIRVGTEYPRAASHCVEHLHLYSTVSFIPPPPPMQLNEVMTDPFLFVVWSLFFFFGFCKSIALHLVILSTNTPHHTTSLVFTFFCS